MSSSAQFPSGLNDWAASDKPMRADFVRDNEILDQNAMWKAEYDPTKSVKTAGGIPAYVSGASVGSAAKLTSARKISLTGDVTAPAVSFNGTGDVPLKTTFALKLTKTNVGLDKVDNVKQMPYKDAKAESVNNSSIRLRNSVSCTAPSWSAAISTDSFLFVRG